MPRLAPSAPPAPRPAVAIAPPQAPVEAPPSPAPDRHLGLPTPPSDDPKRYAAWLHGLASAQRVAVDRFCRANKYDYQRRCGGIGPLHVPVHTPAAYDTWYASLSVAQRGYVTRHCNPDNAEFPGRSTDLCGELTPLVVAFDDRPVAFARDVRFPFAPGVSMTTDWPTAATPWLAIDLDRDGAIENGAELFGTSSVLPDGRLAANGFAALAARDSNHDGVIDHDDPVFASLVLWADRDGDARSTQEELVPAATTIVSISLAPTDAPRCDRRRACERERARLVWRDALGEHVGAVIDVHLPRR